LFFGIEKIVETADGQDNVVFFRISREFLDIYRRVNNPAFVAKIPLGKLLGELRITNDAVKEVDFNDIEYFILQTGPDDKRDLDMEEIVMGKQKRNAPITNIEN
jgi:hypothetical protein